MNWIKAESGQLPPESPEQHTFIKVLVYVPDFDKGTVLENGVRVGWYMHSVGEWRIENSPSKWNVTHWQPMPQPPVKETE